MAESAFLRALQVCFLVVMGTIAPACSALDDRDQAAFIEPKINADENILTVSVNDEIFWNGEQITLNKLSELLSKTAKMQPEPQLRFEPSPGADYMIAADVLRAIKDSGITKFGFVGNERHHSDD